MSKQKSPVKKLPMKNCDFCEKRYQPKKSWQRFCHPDCHDKYWTMKKSSSVDYFKRIEKRIDNIEKKLGIE